MAFTSAVTKVIPQGPGARVAYGTWTNGASTDSGGEISTGLKYVRGFSIAVSSHLGTEVVKHTLNSSSGGKVTIVTSTGAVSGTWQAQGL